MSKIKESRNRPKGTAGLTRRQFLTYSAAAGVLAGSSPLMAAQEKRRGRPGRPPHGGLNRRTLFFNFSHEPDAAKARYFLVAAGRRYSLRRVRKGSAVLKRARRRNLFLRQLPDSALTHVVENAFFSTDVVHFCYVIKNPDRTTGTWSMSSMFFQLPASSVLNAFELGVDRFGTESFPVSAKRQLYRLGRATTPSDLLEEEALKDSTDHATATIGVHPELLSADPDSAADIQKNFIAMNGATIALSIELQRLGPAAPQRMPNQPNSSGWATLTPVTDENGQPFKNQNGNNQGLIQYHPAWNPGIAANGGSQGVHSVLNQVKNDPKLGTDVTGLDPNETSELAGLTGRVWQRHDGFTTVDQSPMAGQAVEDSVKFTLTTQNTESGYSCKGTASAQSDGTVQATLTFTNWYVRWLGIYLLFLDANSNPLDASGVKVTTPPDYDPKEDRGKLASEKALFAMLLGPEFTVLGIPVAHSTATVTFNLPENVSSVRMFGSGPNLHFDTPPDPNDPSTWGDPLPGWLVTAIVNYGVTMLLMGAGATQFLSAIQKAALPLAASIVVDVINVIGDSFRNKDFSKPDVIAQVALATVKALANSLAKRAVWFFALIGASIAEGEAEDAIPIVGQIAMAVSLVAGAATILETTMEIAESPISYVYDLVLTHDLSVTIHPDPKNKVFPQVANYYKVTALFDNGGTPHVQTLDMPGGTVSTLPPVVFRNVPLGGKVNVSVGFYSRSTDRTQNDWLAAKGTTGLVDNTVGQEPKVTIEQFPVPIQSNTIYEHKQKTALDAQGNHLWVTAPAPTVKQSDISCGGAGTLCAFQGITVRQGTSVPPAPGYVGYAWQGFSSGVVSCASGGKGQLDQLANLGVVDPQSGYVTAPCGLETGTQLTYSLLTRGTSNFYLDSTNNVVRQVELDPTPKFDDPRNMQQVWGALNLPSDALLLHPSGRLVSINNGNSKIEVLKIPDTPVTVEEAKMKLLANVFSGQGSRPGLIDAPSAAAVSPEGVILILEDNNSRLQAFDLGGNPVQFFKNQEMPYFLNLEATAGGDTVYLDLAVEFTGYLYVLSFNQGTNLYRLDIYHPDQTDTNPISTTQNVNAAKLTVDFWRNVYTLNYEVLKLPDEKFPSITEPSVSLWVPSTP